jgi:hypothetical protein
MEQNNKLPFLDVMIERRNNRLEFDVYRKPASTNRYITADYHHPQNQKDAAFHSMAHRLCSFQLSDENYKKERLKIITIGQQNEHSRQRIEKIISKHERTSTIANLTTLTTSDTRMKKRISVPFYPSVTNKISKGTKTTRNSTT